MDLSFRSSLFILRGLRVAEHDRPPNADVGLGNKTVASTFLLLSFFALLIAFLIWRNVPRRYLFWIVLMSAWIYALSFFLTLHVGEEIAPRMNGGFLPYLPPMVFVGIFVAWALHQVKLIRAGTPRYAAVTVSRFRAIVGVFVVLVVASVVALSFYFFG